MDKALLRTPTNLRDRRRGSRDDYGTPRWFYDFLDEEFNFSIDVCAKASNHKHENYYALERGQNCLELPWGKPGDTAFCNPPYGKRVPVFLAKGFDEAFTNGVTSAFFIVPRVDTSWWHRWVWAASEVWELEGRVKFDGAAGDAPFPSCVVIFRPGQLSLPEGPKRRQYNLQAIKKATLGKAKEVVYLREFSQQSEIYAGELM